jgi:hypothetical protein
MEIVAALKQEEAKLHKRLAGIRGAIQALGGATGGGKASGTKRRGLSAAARAKISKAAKARWAKIRADKAKGKKKA